MKLDKYTQDILRECALNRTKLIVKGANGIGQPVLIEGCITVVNIGGGEPLIYDDNFSLYQGWEDHKSLLCLTEGLSDYSHTPYLTYVESITMENGKVIFKNEDFERIISESISDMPDYMEPLNREGKRWISLIGKPLTINFEDGIEPIRICVSAVYMKDGEIVLSGRDNISTAKIVISKGDKYTVELDETVKSNLAAYVAKNNKNKR